MPANQQNTTRLTRSQFDNLDHLHNHDAHIYPIHLADLATTMNIQEESAFNRMRRLEKAGLVTITKTHHHDAATFRITEQGQRAYRKQLAIWAGEIPPVTRYSVELASHLATAPRTLFTTGREAAA